MDQNFATGAPQTVMAHSGNFLGPVAVRVAVLLAMLAFGVSSHAQANSPSTLAPVEIKTGQPAQLHPSAASVPQDDLTSTRQSASSPVTLPSPEDAPSTSGPIVNYQHGKLSITAENVRLSDIMSALHGLLGVEISLPAESSNERVWAHLGPGSPRKVLSDLLSNISLDYVIQWSSTDADGIQSVSLTVRSEGSSDRGGASNEIATSANDRRPSLPAAVDNQSSERDEPNSQQAAAGPAPTAPAVAPAGDGPAAGVVAQSSSPTSGQFTNPPPPSSMTADQIAQQLNNMYQQRKQMQQNQTGSTPN